jgi:LytS/YehU family sensor histidine kinase
MYYAGQAEGESPDWAIIFTRQLIHWAMWTALLPALKSVTRFIGRVKNVGFQVTLYGLIGVLISVVQSAAAYGVGRIIVPATARNVTFQLYVREWLLFNLLTYAALISGILAVDHWRRGREQELRAARLDTELSVARLRALQMQLQPHFLFNTLNTVAMLIRTADGRRALPMLAGLGDLLRQALDDDASHEVPLREEMGFLQRYLDIERVRFQDRLCVKVEVPPDALEAHVPRFVLQPLVENAIRHGIEKRPGLGTLSISAARTGDLLSVTVCDDGPGPAPSATDGIGLGNARERIRYLYGDAGVVSLTRGASGGAVTTISLPWHMRPLNGTST